MEHSMANVTETWRDGAYLNNYLGTLDIQHISKTSFYGSILAAVFVASLTPALIRRFQNLPFPLVNPSPKWDLYSLTGMLKYVKEGVNLVVDATNKYSVPFYIMTDFSRKLVLPPEYIDAINSEPALDFQTWNNLELLSSLPAFEVFSAGKDHLIEDVVRIKLTQNLPKFTQGLSDEMTMILRETWTNSSEWRELDIKKSITYIIARLSALVFVGEDLARNQEWTRISSDVTINAFLGVVECRFFPKFLQPLASRFMPHARKSSRIFREGKQLLAKAIEERQQAKAAAIASGKPAPKYNDAIEWCEQVAAGRPYKPLTMQMGLALAAIHTSTDLLTQCVYDLCKYPEVIPALREEISTVVGATGWNKTTLYNLRLLDSFVKESQRVKPIGMMVMNRVALKDVTLAGDVKIRKGDIIAVSCHKLWQDSSYENPTQFDPYRFIKRREMPGHEHTSHLVSTSVDFNAFSHGKHACPGRFFAANEIKIALAHMIMKYDMKMDDPESAVPLRFGIAMQAIGDKKIWIKERKPEIDL